MGPPRLTSSPITWAPRHLCWVSPRTLTAAGPHVQAPHEPCARSKTSPSSSSSRSRHLSLLSLSLSKPKPQPTNPPAKPYLSSTRRPSAPRRWAGGGRRDGRLLQGVPTRPPLLPSAAASASRGRSNRRRSRGSASRRLAPAAASALGCECPRLSVPLHRCLLEEKSNRDRVD